MSGNSQDALGDLLRAETDRLTREALETSGRLSQQQMAVLARLAQLVEIRKGLRLSRPTPFLVRWTAPLVLIVTLGIATLLLFNRVRRTEIELDVRLAELGMRLASDTVFVEDANLVGLGVSGAREISIRGTTQWAGLDLTAPEGESLNLEIGPGRSPQPPGITLSSIHAKAGTRVWIQPGGTPLTVRLSLEGDQQLEVQANLMGMIRLAGTQIQVQTVEFELPRPAYFRAERAVVSLDLTAARLASIHVSPEIDVDRLSFYHVKHFDSQDRRLSSVESGFLYLGALNGSEERLRPGQELRLDNLEGRIRTVQLNPDSLTIQFHGLAGKIETGSYQNPRNLMPTWLEWLRARHGLSLLWGTALYVFGLISAALRWFRAS